MSYVYVISAILDKVFTKAIFYDYSVTIFLLDLKRKIHANKDEKFKKQALSLASTFK